MPYAFWSNILASELANLRALCGCLNGELPRNPNWQAIVAQANRTLTTPSLANRLLGDHRLPNDLAEFFRTIKARTQLRNRLMFAQLTEAVDVMAKRGISPILLRGSALLACGGDNYDDRLLGDLDLLVPGEQASEAFEAMQSVGYRWSESSASRWEGANICREMDAGGIDLHVTLNLPHAPHTYADLAPDCRELSIGQAKALIPSPTLQAAILIIHDQLQDKDYWRGLVDLRHLLDLKLLLDGQDAIEWDRLVAFFPPGYARRALHTQMLTLSELFDVQIPVAARHSTAARIQLGRRQLQMRFRWLAPCNTLLTLLVDPPLGRISEARTQVSEELGSSPLENRLRALQRMFLAPKPTKV